MAEKFVCDGVSSRNLKKKYKMDGQHYQHHQGGHHNNQINSLLQQLSSGGQNPNTNVDRLKLLYPNVNELETPLPRSWSPVDKCSSIGLSQQNLRVHYKGTYVNQTKVIFLQFGYQMKTYYSFVFQFSFSFPIHMFSTQYNLKTTKTLCIFFVFKFLQFSLFEKT